MKNEVGGTCKINIKMSLKSRSYILDLDHVVLGNFLFSELFNGEFFYQLSGSTFIFVKNSHKKTANLVFHLILHVSKVPWFFLEVQCILRLLVGGVIGPYSALQAYVAGKSDLKVSEALRRL